MFYFLDANQKAITLLNLMIVATGKVEQSLDSKKEAQVAKFALQVPLDNDQKQALLFNLQQLSGKQAWHVSQKNALIAWIEILGENANDPLDSTEAERVKKILQGTGAMDVLLSRRQDNKVPVIKCSNINCDTLNVLVTAQAHQTPTGIETTLNL